MARIFKNSFWLISGAAGLLLLVACNSPETTDAEPAVSNVVTAEAEPEDTAVPPTAAPTETPIPEPTATVAPTEMPPTEASTEIPIEEPEETITLEDGTVVLTTDDRSRSLQAATFSWDTNWELHTVDYSDILSGGPPRDGIPSIDNPQFVTQTEAEAWLQGTEPVVAVDLAGEARAYPLQILTWHEIVNDTIGDLPIIVTFCPLCNSAIVFERTLDGEPVEFGTSGLLRNSDLIMYDRRTETLWQQFTGEAIVGDKVGTTLTFLPSSLISFNDFRTAYPDGVVLSQETGFDRDYGRNPYAGYDSIGNTPFLFTGDLDGRLQAVERVVTVSLDEGTDVAYPLSVLSEAGVINDTQGATDLVVFHLPGTNSALGADSIASAKDVGATGVFNPVVNGQKLTFSLEGDQFVDAETGTSWNIVGQAVAGELAGEQLEPVIHGDHFWFSWAAFKPETIIYENDE